MDDWAAADPARGTGGAVRVIASAERVAFARTFWPTESGGFDPDGPDIVVDVC